MNIFELTDLARQFARSMMSKYGEAGLKNLDMHMDTRQEQPVAELSDIWVNKEIQGSGVGTQVMREITQWADQSGVTLYLSLGTKDKVRGTTSSSRLIKFYKQFGFINNKGRGKRFDLSMYAQMYREPR
jgi:GNAT superfamily N-acetyltransferase